MQGKETSLFSPRKEECVGFLVECQGTRAIVTTPAILNVYNIEKKILILPRIEPEASRFKGLLCLHYPSISCPVSLCGRGSHILFL